MKDPITLFQDWLQEAVDAGLKDPTAMTVATVDADGPDARTLSADAGGSYHAGAHVDPAHAVGAKKSDKTFAGVPIDKATEYAAEDADVTLRLWMALKPRLAAERMTTVYETLERPLLPVVVAMERAGIKVDKPILSRLSSQFAQQIARLDEEVQQLSGHKFNLASPKQLGEFLFDTL